MTVHTNANDHQIQRSIFCNKIVHCGAFGIEVAGFRVEKFDGFRGCFNSMKEVFVEELCATAIVVSAESDPFVKADKSAVAEVYFSVCFRFNQVFEHACGRFAGRDADEGIGFVLEGCGLFGGKLVDGGRNFASF
jgi:hypothetical protein